MEKTRAELEAQYEDLAQAATRQMQFANQAIPLEAAQAHWRTSRWFKRHADAVREKIRRLGDS